ncbi:MAG: circadian clock protein KaiC [Balneolaceae bacterium]
MNKKREGDNFRVKPQLLPKVPTKIKGLDEVLNGGLPEGRLTIVSGGPGAGKTIFGLELLVRGIEAGNPAVFISFEESGKAMRQNALSMGWDLSKIEKNDKLALITPEIDFDAVSSGEFHIDGLCAILEGQARRINAKIIVIDAVDMLMRLYNTPERARSQFVTLNRWLVKQNLTAVMTVKETEDAHTVYDYLDFMADCVIKLDQRVHEQVTTRRLHVTKYRGSDFSNREHPFVITRQGIVVMPLTSLDLVQQSIGKLISSSNEKLDVVLGGGFRKGSSVLISGPSGSGKTTLAFMLSEGAAKRGERVLYLSFEQSELSLSSEMKSVGFDLQSQIENGNLRIVPVMPESMGMEEHLYSIIFKIEDYKPDHVVLDAISATDRIGSSQAALDFLIRLYHVAKKRNITCIYTNQTISSKKDELIISGVGISSLVDTAILLNYFRDNDRIGRSVLVLKSRGTRHSDRYHEFRITDEGIVIVDSANN